MKNVDLSNDIASGMDAALRDEDNNNMFSSSAMLEKLAFSRVADEDKQTEVEAELVKVASVETPKAVEQPKGFTVLASVATLVQLSEDLDNNGFDRLAAVSLLLAEKLIVEAKAKKSKKSAPKSKSKSKPKSKVDMKERMKKMREMKGGKKKDPSKDSKKEDKSKSKSK